MEKKKRLQVWLPVIIAISIILGIFIGSSYNSFTIQKEMISLLQNNKIQNVLSLISMQYVDSVDMEDLTEKTIPKILDELDPHSVYIPAKDAQAMNDDVLGSFSGIGVSFNMQTDTILVISVIHGGPAEKAGLLPFDRIITINDSIFSGKKRAQEDVMKNLKGPNGSQVSLGILRGDNKELINFDVTRGKIPVNSVDVSYYVKDAIGYIKISKFTRTTHDELITAIAKLKAEKTCEGFIIDLRSNGGGVLDVAINMINEFMPEERLLVYTEGEHMPRSEAYSNGTGLCKEDPLVLLTDEFSASASEIFAGAVQDNDRGLIIGRRTFGKGLVQSPITLADGSEIRLTIARYHTASGRCIQKAYEKGKGAEYDEDIYKRFLHGEFDSADSIKANTKETFKTRMGRTVYGGGGVMPDIFIPRDTTGVTSYFSSVINSGVLYRFALEHSEANRKTFEKFKTWEELNTYLKNSNLLNTFTSFAATQGIKKRPYYIRISAKLMEKQLRAYIVRNFFDDEGFYPIFMEDDVTLWRAVDILKSGKWKPTLKEK